MRLLIALSMLSGLLFALAVVTVAFDVVELQPPAVAYGTSDC
jgi:hypothetical protein